MTASALPDESRSRDRAITGGSADGRITITFGPRLSFWVAAAVVTHALWTSAAPAMTYPLYGKEWHLTPTETTAIFAVYPIVVGGVLIGLGDVSDYIGRRATMLMGLGASLLGVLLFAVAPDIRWVFIGRALMGVGVGLSAAPATAAMVEFSPAGQSSRAGSITTAAQALGIALAMLVGGGLIQYAPFPTRLNFCALFIVIAVVFAATWFLPRHTSGEASGKWRPKAPFIPKGLRWIFTISTTAVTMCYALGALMLGMGAQMAHDLIGSDNVLVNGAAMSSFPVVSGVVGVLARRLLPSKSMILGGAASMCGMLLLVLSSSYHGLLIFLAANALAGIGYSLSFTGGLNLLNAHAPPHHRGGTLSALFLVAYLIQGAAALLLGVVATTWGLKTSIELGSVTLGFLGALVAALAFSGRGITPPARSFEQSRHMNSTF